MHTVVFIRLTLFTVDSMILALGGQGVWGLQERASERLTMTYVRYSNNFDNSIFFDNFDIHVDRDNGISSSNL